MKIFKKLLITTFIALFVFSFVGIGNTKTLQQAIRDDGLAGNIKKKIEFKSSNFTYAVGDPIPIIDTTSGNVTVTLPPITDWDDEAYRSEIELAHSSGTNDVIVQLSGAETFAWGNTYFNLGSAFKGFTFAAIRNGSTTKYGILRNITVHASGHRAASWASTNFSSMTIIPLDGEDYNNQDELLVYTSGASAKYTMLAAGDYYVSYYVIIDSTGGSTWNATVQLYKNGSSLGTAYSMRGGNYGNEDDSVTLPRKELTLAASDYIDLRIDQNNLTGNLIYAAIIIEIRL